MSNGPLGLHQSRRRFELRLPEAGCVLVVTRTLTPWNRVGKSPYLGGLGPDAIESCLRAPEHRSHGVVFHAPNRKRGCPHLKEAVHLRLPATRPIATAIKG